MNETITTGKVEHCTGFDRKQLQEIDIRVGAKLLERELYRGEYIRGMTDALYWIFILVTVSYAVYVYFKAEE